MSIKYRIWSNKYKLFTHDPRWPSNQHTHEEYVLTPGGEVWTMVTADFENYFRVLDDSGYVVQRATGLKDKNNKEIFEGDIVNYSLDRNDFQDKVVFENFGWNLVNLENLGSSFPLTSGLEYQIIGNTFENPEMTK